MTVKNRCLLSMVICFALAALPVFAWGESITIGDMREKIDRICAEYKLSSDVYWTFDESNGDPESYTGVDVPAGMDDYTIYSYSGEKGCMAFMAFLGECLFPDSDAFSAWEMISTPPLAKAGGLRIGDVICTDRHAAMIFDIHADGEIRTVEMDDQDGRITINGYFAEDESCGSFDQIVEKYGFECLFHIPGNTSAVLWSGRMAALPEEPTVTGETYPTVLSNDQFFGLRGMVACRYPIQRIRATVTNRVTGEIVFDVSVYPNANTYKIGDPVSETINDQLVFNSPECANSWLKYKLEVSYLKEGKSFASVILDRNFKVGSPLTEEPEGDKKK